MENWELDFEWLRVRHVVKDALDRPELPDLNAILFLIGIQELGRWQKAFTKEEKQDLMHIAVCKLLSFQGYYRFVGRDQDGWPHWEQDRQIPATGVKAQERLLKEMSILYFREWEKESNTVQQTEEEE